jgi:replicative DNA helicase
MSLDNANENPLHDVEIEKFLLGAMLLKDGASVPVVMSILDTDDFYRPEHRIIYNCIKNIYLLYGVVDLQLLVSKMKDTGEADKIGLPYILGITEIAHTDAYQKHYAEIIKGKAQKRNFIERLQKIATDVKNPLTDFSDNIFNAEQAISEVRNSTGFNTRLTDGAEYYDKFFDADISANMKLAQRKTGFSNIDDNQIFNAGLYVIGATPACGKTTFCWQMLNQLAQDGETCIFCSYEMSRLELFSKTVASELFQLDNRITLTAADIRRGAYNQAMDLVKDDLKQRTGLKVIELSDETVDDLIKLLTPIVKKSDKPPVVCIDYLQIIPSTKDNFNAKQGIDDTVRKLKVFQRQTGTTFIVVSSFNRSNYNSSVSFESFKESGNIEFTADVVWALQLNILNHFKAGTDVNKIRKTVDDAKKHQPREIQLKCLKNRSGNNYDCFFKYYSAHDYFVPCEEKDFTQSLKELQDVQAADENPDNED